MKQQLVLKIAVLAVLGTAWQAKANGIQQKLSSRLQNHAQYSSAEFNDWLTENELPDCGCEEEIPTPVPTTYAACEIPTTVPTTVPATTYAACEIPTTVPTTVPTTIPVPPIIPIPPSNSTQDENCTCEEDQGTEPPAQCTAENTINWQYNSEHDCNWVYNEESCAMECVHQECEWQFDSANCSWHCEDIVIPPSNQSENCSVSCEDFEALSASVQELSEQFFLYNTTLLNQVAEHVVVIEGAIGQILQTQQSLGAAIDALTARVAALEGRNHIAEARDSIRASGLYFGNRWWIGEQYEQLWAIDVLTPAFYRFQSGVNATLG